jgi:hypothetical protein
MVTRIRCGVVAQPYLPPLLLGGQVADVDDRNGNRRHRVHHLYRHPVHHLHRGAQHLVTGRDLGQDAADQFQVHFAFEADGAADVVGRAKPLQCPLTLLGERQRRGT